MKGIFQNQRTDFPLLQRISLAAALRLPVSSLLRPVQLWRTRLGTWRFKRRRRDAGGEIGQLCSSSRAAAKTDDGRRAAARRALGYCRSPLPPPRYCTRTCPPVCLLGVLVQSHFLQELLVLVSFKFVPLSACSWERSCVSLLNGVWSASFFPRLQKDRGAEGGS